MNFRLSKSWLCLSLKDWLQNWTYCCCRPAVIDWCVSCSILTCNVLLNEIKLLYHYYFIFIPIYNIIEVDAFIIFTDFAQRDWEELPGDVMRRYRELSGKKDAKLIICSLSTNAIHKPSITGGDDYNMLDICCGFDPYLPVLISNFVKGL